MPGIESGSDKLNFLEAQAAKVQREQKPRYEAALDRFEAALDKADDQGRDRSAVVAEESSSVIASLEDAALRDRLERALADKDPMTFITEAQKVRKEGFPFADEG